jgi:hypothetical protein
VKLLKAQSSHFWQGLLKTKLEAMGYEWNPYDLSLYFKTTNDCLSIILIHVDDLLIGEKE